jgi:tRNA modification GTPase
MRTYKIGERNATIAAIATAMGVGGINVVRISGDDAFQIVDKVFLGKFKLDTVPSHTAHFGRVVGYDGNFVDEVVAVVFRRPNSYTCEDVVEISCHGGYIVTQKVLQEIFNAGARPAEPGEFTKRAFLNGRLDLSQAEAVGDLIHSQSEAAYRSSIRQLSGDLSKEIKSVSDELVNLAALLELELDFSEESVEFADRKSLEERLTNAIVVVDRLLSSYSVGRIYREGVRVTIVGKPNAGKSSLLNALIKEDRAIVSEIPGTTRDTISESMSINGVLFRMTDTAGIREALDSIEQEGVERARREAEKSDILLLVIDCSLDDYNGIEPLYRQLADRCERGHIKLLRVWNKVDLYEGEAHSKPEEDFYVSALRGDGIDLLRNGLFRTAHDQSVNDDHAVVTNARHRDALSRARKSLHLALESLKGHRSSEFISLDLRAGLDSLGEITGEVTTDDILNKIFSKFCIGK